jgi:hypothetical protein
MVSQNRLIAAIVSRRWAPRAVRDDVVRHEDENENKECEGGEDVEEEVGEI